MHSADSGPLALPRDDVAQRAQAALPSFDEITAPLRRASAVGRPTEDVLAHPLNPAEVAQARRFEQILRAEIAKLEQLAGRWPADLVEVRGRIDEARRLLETLQGRFLRPCPGDRRGPTSPSR